MTARKEDLEPFVPIATIVFITVGQNLHTHLPVVFMQVFGIFEAGQVLDCKY